MTQTTLYWRHDPGHAWLIISRADLLAAGLTEADISPYSYQRGDMLALEADCDAGTYLAARYPHADIDSLTHDEREVQSRDLPRNWQPFGRKGRA